MKTLKKIAHRLIGIGYSDLTEAEKQILDILVEESILVKVEDEHETFRYEFKGEK